MRWISRCAIFGLGLLLMAQSSDPVSVSVGTLIQHPKGPSIPITIINNSAKPIAAWAVFVDVFENGKVAATMGDWAVPDAGFELRPGASTPIEGLHLPAS